MRRVISALAAGAAFFVPVAAEARPGDRIGEAVVVVNQVTAELSRDVRTLAKGDPVRHSELVVAGSDARTELALDDSTKLALGPGARVRLDKFVYDPDRHSGSILVDLVTGTFRFITGVASKPSYLIRTPTAAITVRGTIFDVFVRRGGETWVLLSEGGIEACTAAGKCRVLDKPGSILVVTSDGELGTPTCWRRFGSDLDFGFDEAFPFVARPPTVDRDPVLTRASATGDETCAAAPKQRRAEAPPPKPQKAAPARVETPERAPARQARIEPQPKVSYDPPVRKRVKIVKDYEPQLTRPPIKVVELPPIVYRPPVIDLPRRHWPGRDTMPSYPGKLPGGKLPGRYNGKLPGGLSGKLPGGGYGRGSSGPTIPMKYPGKLPGGYAGKLPGSSSMRLPSLPMKMPSMPTRMGGCGGGGSMLR